jgi:hypothetical protein
MIRDWNNFFFFTATGLFAISLVCFAAVTADSTIHWDSKNYFRGYEAVYSTGSISAANEHFGKITEFVFPLFYLILSVFPKINSPEMLIIIHSILFAILFIISVILCLKRGYFNTAQSVLIYGMVPPGVALQIGRQAVAFCIILIMVAVVRKTKWQLFIALLASSATHLMSIPTAIFYTLFFRKMDNVKIVILPIILFLLFLPLTLLLDVGALPAIVRNYLNITFVPKVLGSNSVFGVLLLFGFLLAYSIICLKIPKWNLIVLVLVINIAIWYYFSLSRLLFGYYFFILPLFLISSFILSRDRKVQIAITIGFGALLTKIGLVVMII